MPKVCSDFAVVITASNHSIEQYVFAFVADQIDQSSPLIIGDFQRQRKSYKPEADDVKIEISPPVSSRFLLL
ncbi:hypothetical protein WL27_12760 [Burkholderia multivorans]|nr:hypothetical protein WL27_12760 [Burkholderia multivorans]